MEPGQNVAPVSESDTVVKGASEKGGSKGMFYGMILCIILAIGGICFGVWAMMDGNSQKEFLCQQISTLKQQDDELQEKITELESTIKSGGDVSDDVSDTYGGVLNAEIHGAHPELAPGSATVGRSNSSERDLCSR